MSPRSIIIVEDDAVPALTWTMSGNSLTVNSWSVAIVIVATVAPILIFFSDHCFTRCQGYQQRGSEPEEEIKDSFIDIPVMGFILCGVRFRM